MLLGKVVGIYSWQSVAESDSGLVVSDCVVQRWTAEMDSVVVSTIGRVFYT